MAVNARWRYDEFEDTFYPLSIVDEEHTIEFISEIAKYGFFADESVYFESPSSVSVIEDTTGGATFTEVSRLSNPGTEQFRVSYDAESYFNTGFIECNAADNGKNILLSYKGLGTIAHPTFRLNRDFNLPGNLIIEGNLSMNASGDDVNEISKDGTLASNSNTALVSEQAIKTYVDTNFPFKSFEIITSSQTWTKPTAVSHVFIEACGGGGGGAGSSQGPANVGGGGGGSSGEIRTGLFTVTSDLTITIGSGGAGSSTGSSPSSGTTGSNTTISGGASITCRGGLGGGGSFGEGSDGSPSGGSGGTRLGSFPGQSSHRIPIGRAAAGDIINGGKGGGSGTDTSGGKILGSGGNGGNYISGGASTSGQTGGNGYVKIWY